MNDDTLPSSLIHPLQDQIIAAFKVGKSNPLAGSWITCPVGQILKGRELLFCFKKKGTLPKTNIAPKNCGFQ